MLKRLAPKVDQRVASCSIADLLKPEILGACMRTNHVSDYHSGGLSFYSLKDSKGNVLREGITTRKLSARVREYEREAWFPRVSQVCVQPFNRIQDLRTYERARVGCDCPPFNKQLKSTCRRLDQ